MVTAHEYNFDGIVGQTHNYAGLSPGNLASDANKGSNSRPRQAALQGLHKMKALADMGFRQGIIPPQERPDLRFLRAIGFSGSDANILTRAASDAPEMLAAACASSAMWTANAATVSPGADTEDARVHFTPANLISNAHRALESETTSRILRSIFRDERHFLIHDPLPTAPTFGDEGAANHTRFCADEDGPGVEFFVYGRVAAWDHDPEHRLARAPKRFPARQTLEASAAIARRHRLDPARTVFAQQNPEAIDRGVFHNDVVAVGHRTLLFHHEHAFTDSHRVVDQLRAAIAETCDADLMTIQVSDDEITLEEAVRTYLFNSQLLSPTRGGMVLIAPQECRESDDAAALIDRLIRSDSPITAVHYFDLRQSMRNGGGPACLRLRVTLTVARQKSHNLGSEESCRRAACGGRCDRWRRKTQSCCTQKGNRSI